MNIKRTDDSRYKTGNQNQKYYFPVFHDFTLRVRTIKTFYSLVVLAPSRPALLATLAGGNSKARRLPQEGCELQSYSHSSFYTVHSIQKCSKYRVSIYCMLGNSFHFSLFLDYFTHPSPSSRLSSSNRSVNLALLTFHTFPYFY